MQLLFLAESLPPSPKSIHKSQIDGNSTTQNEESGVENKKESDKKMVKNILSHLLPSNANTSLLPVRFFYNCIVYFSSLGFYVTSIAGHLVNVLIIIRKSCSL